MKARAALQSRMQLFLRSLVTLVVLLSGLFTTALAARLTMEASQDRVAVGESLQLVFRFEGLDRDDFPPVTLPAGLSVVGESTSSSFRMINGQTSSEISLVLTVQADKEGTYAVGPFQMTAEGQVFKTEPMTLTVKPARVSGRSLGPGNSGQPAEGGDAAEGEGPFVVRQSLSRDQIFVGQWAFLQIDLESYASGPQIEYQQLQLPETEGLRVEDLGKPQSLSRIENGRRISIVRVLKRITPLAAGSFTLPGARAIADILVPVRGSGRSLFDSMFGNVERRRFVLSAEPRALQVAALPSEGRPTNFSGVVGSTSWTVNFPVDPAVGMKTGDSLTLTVTVESEGELSGLSMPAPAAPEHLKIYEDNPRSQTISRQGKVLQVKEWKFAVVPTAPGAVQLGELQLNFFDPDVGRYENLSQSFPAFNVVGEARSPLVAGQSSQRLDAGGVPDSRSGAVPLERKGVDIYPIRTDLRADFAPGRFEAARHIWYLLFPAAGFIFVVLTYFVGQLRGWAEGQGVRRRSRGALHIARQQIEAVLSGSGVALSKSYVIHQNGIPQAAGDQSMRPPALVLAAVKDYLSTRLSVQVSQKTAAELRMLLEPAVQDSGRVEVFTRGLQDLEQLLYLPSDAGGGARAGADPSFAMKCKSLLDDLEWIDREISGQRAGR